MNKLIGLAELIKFVMEIYDVESDFQMGSRSISNSKSKG